MAVGLALSLAFRLALANPASVYSPPVEAGPYTVITAAEVSAGMGFGYGGGGAPETAAKPAPTGWGAAPPPWLGRWP